MIRAVLRDGVFYGLASIFSRGLAVLVLPFYTRVLSPADYGALDMLITFGALANLTVALEISQAVARYYSDIEYVHEKRRFASTAWWFTVGMYGVFLIGTLFTSIYLTKLVLGDIKFLLVFRLGLLLIVVDGLFYLIQNQFRWELKSRQYAAVSLLYSLMTIACGVGLAYGMRMGMKGVLVGQIVAATIATCYGWWQLRNSFAWEFDWQKLGVMLHFSSPLVPAGIAVFISLYINRLALNSLTSLNEVGLFGMGFRLASVAGLLIVGIQGALTPLIYAHYRAPDTPAQLARLFDWFVAIALVGSLALGLFADEILRVFATQVYYAAAPTVILLAPALLLSQMYIFTPGMAISKKTHWQLWITIVSAVLSSVLNWILIPLLGITGAALATLISGFVSFIVWVVLSQRLYPIPFRWCPILLATLLTSVVAITGQGAAYVGLNTKSAIALKVFLVTISGSGVFMFRLVQQDDMKRAWSLVKGKLSELYQE